MVDVPEFEGEPWMQTFMGLQFFRQRPRIESVHIEDIAHALSMVCRFGGHCRYFYSVGEHSVHVSYLVARTHALWGLLHDAHEAYGGDILKPYKTGEQRAAEALIQRSVCKKFGLPLTMPAEVAFADLRMLATEKLALMKPEPCPWMKLPAPANPEMIRCWEPRYAKQMFLERFEELVTERK